MPRILLETERLRLRNTQEDDVPGLVRMWTDPEVSRFMGGKDAAWLEQTFRADARQVEPLLYDQWPVFEKSSGELIGYCGLLDKEVEGRQEVELTYALVRSAWGQGYATEISAALREYAWNQMGLKRLIALIDQENAASARVAERLGFHLERKIIRPSGAERMLYVLEK
jgi:[ribosomal protein S5]-alanine N-acetyltransferase